MDLVIALVVGGLVGWMAGLIMGTDGQMGVLANMLVGEVGSVLGLGLPAVLGVPVSGTPARWVVPLIGALVLIAIVRALGMMRPRPLV